MVDGVDSFSSVDRFLQVWHTLVCVTTILNGSYLSIKRSTSFRTIVFHNSACPIQ